MRINFMLSNESQANKQIAQVCGRLDKADPAPLYRQLVERISHAIRDGSLPNGMTLPPQKQLAELLDVSQITIRRAMADLIDAHLIQSTRGSGTIITGHAKNQITPQPVNASNRLRIGIVYTSLSDGYPFILPILKAIENAAMDGKSTSPVIQTHYLDPNETHPDIIKQQLPLTDVDGLILMSPVNTAALTICRELGTRYVLLFNDLSDVGSTCITCDYVPGIFDVIKHFSANGIKRPAFVSAGMIRYSTGAIMDALSFACDVHGMELLPQFIRHADYTQEQSYHMTMDLLKQNQRPDAIIYSSENQAQGGIIAAQELGIAIPDELAIVATGSPSTDVLPSRRVTLVDIGLAKMSSMAVQFIQQWKANTAKANTIPRRSTVRSKLVPGNTTQSVV
jgi:DNA-binding LacI/PurR family transcriptional regulator